jgi:hypothetical protein
MKNWLIFNAFLTEKISFAFEIVSIIFEGKTDAVILILLVVPAKTFLQL